MTDARHDEPKPLCALLPEPLTGEFADYLRSPDGFNTPWVFPMGEDRFILVQRLLFHWTLIIGEIDVLGYTTRYCYAHDILALSALAEWHSRGWEGEPIGWHRHPCTKRRRPDGDPSREYVEG